MNVPAAADEALKWVRQQLIDVGIEDARADALALFSHVTGLDQVALLRDPSQPLTRVEQMALKDIVSARLAGRPVARIIGRRDFMGLNLALNEATLEPRFDTEVLVEDAVAWLKSRPWQTGPKVLDIGTGSGAIALAIANKFKQATITASDIAPQALAMAKQNAGALGLAAHIEFVESDYFAALSGTYDLIVSNPPYIALDVIEGLADEVKNFDPHLALSGGKDGLDAYRILAREARAFLSDGGIVALEIGFDQKHAVTELFEAAGFVLVRTTKDFGGRDRVLLFT